MSVAQNKARKHCATRTESYFEQHEFTRFEFSRHVLLSNGNFDETYVFSFLVLLISLLG